MKNLNSMKNVLLYECKMCGGRFTSGCQSSMEHMQMVFNTLAHGNEVSLSYGFGTPPNLQEVHNCSNGIQGVGILIGMVTIPIEKEVEQLIPMNGLLQFVEGFRIFEAAYIAERPLTDEEANIIDELRHSLNDG